MVTRWLLWFQILYLYSWQKEWGRTSVLDVSPPFNKKGTKKTFSETL